jgi:ABC-type uncharacterized transport system substrate-binding protein
VESENGIIDWRYTEGDVERAPRLAVELFRLNVDVILATSPANVEAAQRAISSIPTVMHAVADPVGMRFVGKPSAAQWQRHWRARFS